MKNQLVKINVRDTVIPILSQEDIEKYNKSISYIHIFKCRSQDCGLEFTIFSWDTDWSKKFEPFCPECGKQGAINLRMIERNRKIYDIVYSHNLGNEK